jgi:hypothetical protein
MSDAHIDIHVDLIVLDAPPSPGERFGVHRIAGDGYADQSAVADDTVRRVELNPPRSR